MRGGGGVNLLHATLPIPTPISATAWPVSYVGGIAERLLAVQELARTGARCCRT